MATINISTTAQLIAAIGTGPGSAQDGDTLSFAAGDYTGVAIDISDGRDLTFVSANAGVDPDNWVNPPVILDRIVSTGSITVDGIHVHATLGGDAHNSPNGPYWQAIGTATAGTDVTVLNSILTITADVAGSIPQPFGLNLTYGGGDIIVDHVHFGPFIGLPPENTAYGVWINGTAPASSVTITNNEFETGAPKNAAVAFDGQHGGPNIIITDNDFEDPGVSPGAIRFFDFADVLSGPQDFSGVGGNTMHGDGPVISNESGEAIVNTTSNDIVGTTGDDTFLASAGNDHIDGLGGSDTIDMANAGAGGSVVDLDVGSGGVAVSVATGLDTLTSIENVKGSAGADYIAGDSAANDLAGAAGDDHIQGRGGADHIDGGTGADAMDGGDGDDTYIVDNIGDTTVEGSGIGSGADTVLSSVSYALGANVENLTLTDAGSGSENFETFDTGPITDGENGWKHAGSHDQEVVDLGGNKVFRMSSDPASGDFGGPYSPDLGVSAGEPQTTADGDVQLISFRVKAVDPTSDNSRLEVDFGTAAGTDRNNFMVIESIAGEGIRIAVNEPHLDGSWANDDFSAFTGNRTLIDHIPAGGWLNIELRAHYVDGPDNDVIDVYLNGTLIGHTTTFENYRDAIGGTHSDNAEDNQTSRIFFRGGDGGQPQDGPGGQNQGFYFDDLSNIVTHNSNATGNALDNIITGNSGDNILTGQGGNDTIHGGGGTDTSVYTVTLATTDIVFNVGDNTWMVHAGATDNDTLSDVEMIDDAAAGHILLVGGDGYATIQQAIDAASNGDTIIVAPGTYDETVTVNKDVTLLGANFDHPGNGARGLESNITGGVQFTAAGAHATLNGFEISGTSGFGAGLDRPVGVLIGADDVHVSNNVLTGSAADTRPFDAYNSAHDFVVDHNLVTGWSQGVYIVVSTSGTIENNVFEHNGNGVVTESTHVIIVGNTFSDSEGTHVAPLPSENASIATFVHDNIFLDQARPISVYLNGTADHVTGSDVAETIHGEYVAGPVTLDGAGGDDYLIGGANGDTLNGGTGNDTVEGGAGADTMDGGADNDTYLVDNAADVIHEAAGGGTDTVLSSVSYTIADDDVENLTLTDAGSGSENFENFDTGPITDGENGWKHAGSHDQEVVDLGGNKVFRMSSDPASGDFGGPYSPDLGVSAGEPQTTADGDAQIISFRVKAVDPTSDNSRLEVDFGTAAGTDRNNFMVIESIAGEGIRIAVNEPHLDGSWANDDFSAFTGNRTLIDHIPAGGWLNIELRAHYVDGPDNDVIDVYLNGTLIGHTTTFENYRDAIGGTHSDNAEDNQTSRIFFRGGDGGQPQDGPGGQNQGFYFDDLSNIVTHDSNGTGNGSANVITGNSGDNVLSGLGGNDTLNGLGGNDTLIGGQGTNSLNGGAGDDLLVVAAGDNDVVDGGAGNDTVNVVGTAADETVHAIFSGGALTSLGGNVQNVEAISLDMAGNTAAGDTLDYSGSTVSIAVDLGLGSASGFTSVAGVENVIGGSGANSIIGNGSDNVFNGGAGSDFINGGGGTDTVVLDGDFADYTITESGGTYTVKTGNDTDIVTNVEKFKIGGVTVNVAQALTNQGPSITSITDPQTGAALAIDENTAATTLVATVSATDPNLTAGLHDHLTYSLQTTGGGVFTGPFSIDADDGEIRVSGPLDFEASASYGVKVVVTDVHGNVASQNVTINLGDLNEGLPGSGAASQTTPPTEAGSTKALLNTVALVDPEGDALTYTILGLPGQGALFVDNAAATVNQVLSQAQFLALKFSSPEAAGTPSMQFDVSDGTNHTILNLSIAVSAPVNATYTGTAGVDRLDGGGGNDVIDGLGGADVMIGGTGKDFFVVDNAGDKTIELAGQGTDTVVSSISFNLAANVERLVLTGGSAINGIGNTGNNTITGNGAANILSGGAGNDVLSGAAGNDRLAGGAGIDILHGGAGNDAFLFNAPLSSANRDYIKDFSHVDDTLQLENAIFTKLGAAGGLDANFFHAGTAAADADDYIIYNHSTGGLFYDADGNGAGAATAFAVLTTKPTLGVSDFLVI